jgi:hypothetical protein
MLALKLFGNFLGTKDRFKTYLAYKIIIENKKFNPDSSDDFNKYHYRAALYHYPLKTNSSITTMQKLLLRGTPESYAVNIKDDLIQYFEEDTAKRPYNELIRPDYDDIN